MIRLFKSFSLPPVKRYQVRKRATTPLWGFNINLNPEILEKILIPLNSLVNGLSSQEREQYESTIKILQQTVETQNATINKLVDKLAQKQ